MTGVGLCGRMRTMRRQRQAKIVATLGLGSFSPDVTATLFQACADMLAGADMSRLTFHGHHEEHRARYDIIPAIDQETDQPIDILVQSRRVTIGPLVRSHGAISAQLTGPPSGSSRSCSPLLSSELPATTSSRPGVISPTSPVPPDRPVCDGQCRLRSVHGPPS